MARPASDAFEELVETRDHCRGVVEEAGADERVVEELFGDELCLLGGRGVRFEESLDDGVARVDAFVRDMKGPSLIVSHGAMARCFIGYTCDIPRIDITHLPTPQGCYCVLENGKYQWFDANHKAV